MLSREQKQAYETFFAATTAGDILAAKTAVMVQLAASFVISGYP